MGGAFDRRVCFRCEFGAKTALHRLRVLGEGVHRPERYIFLLSCVATSLARVGICTSLQPDVLVLGPESLAWRELLVRRTPSWTPPDTVAPLRGEWRGVLRGSTWATWLRANVSLCVYRRRAVCRVRFTPRHGLPLLICPLVVAFASPALCQSRNRVTSIQLA